MATKAKAEFLKIEKESGASQRFTGDVENRGHAASVEHHKLHGCPSRV
jgi:hypothetical protein